MQTTNLGADTICRTVELGLTIISAAINETVTRIDCRPVEYNPTCPNGEQRGRLRDHTERPLTDLPVVGHPTRLRLRIPRFTRKGPGCEATHHIWRPESAPSPSAVGPGALATPQGDPRLL